MIKISDLKNIRTPEQFFSTDKILFVDLIHIGKASDTRLKDIAVCNNILAHADEMYHVVMMMGEPQNMFINAKRGIPFDLGNGVRGIYQWDGDLLHALENNKVYDFTKHHARHKERRERIEPDAKILIERYLLISGAVRKNKDILCVDLL